MVAVAGLLLLSAVLLGHWTPLQAQEGEAAAPEATGASGVTIRLDDLVGLITYAFVDRFDVQLANLNAATTYEIVVSSSNAAALGIGGCGEATQRATVTGATARTVEFRVYACGLGAGTVTAALRAAGASRAAVTVSQGVTVEPIPEWVPEDERPARGARGAVAQVGTPSSVRNPRFEQIMTTSVVAKWDTPTADGGEDLSGYGLLFWHEDEEHPSYRDDVLVKGLSPREHTYTGLQHDATYKFRIHACNEDDQMVARCGWWTTPPLEVTTKRAPTPQRPHTIGFSQLTASSVVVTWSAAANTGGVPLTGFDITYWPYDSENPNSETGARTHPADGGTDRGETLKKLAASTEYELKMRACNGPKDSHCSRWSADHRFTTLAETTPTPTPTTTPTTTPTPTPTLAAPRPQNLDLAPRGGHRARLSWTWPTGAPTNPLDYRITGRVFGRNPITNSDYSWEMVRVLILSGPTEDTDREIDLSEVLTTGNESGLADHIAYELRVEAIFGTRDDDGHLENVTYSAPSDRIIVIDTPITWATAANASNSSQVTIEYNDVSAILKDNDYAEDDDADNYSFRYQRVSHNLHSHTNLEWTPSVFTPLGSGTSLGLASERIYGVQLVVEPLDEAKPRVYAARDAYVWPSSRAPALRERVASFPIGWDAVDDGTYTYRICNHTLPLANRMGWHGFIKHAMGHWGSVTSGRIKAEFESGDCEDYSPLTDRAVNTAINRIKFSSPDDTSTETQQQNRSELNKRIKGMFEMLAQMGYDYGRSGTSIRQINEVRLIISTDDNEDLLAAAAFSQVSKNVGFPACGIKAYGCANISDGHADIFINHRFFTKAKLNLPSGFRFDRCLDSSGVPMEGVDVRLYATIVHEVTHVFGINYPPQSSTQEVSQEMGHPNSELISIVGHRQGLCSPTQLDRLAINAKYQSQN